MSTPRDQLSLSQPSVSVVPDTGHIRSDRIETSVRTIADLHGVFADEAARSSIDQDQIVYHVERYQPVPDGTSGGLFFGTSFLQPGTVGGEYFMTKGHFHARPETAEYYWCVAGEGALILMDSDRSARAEFMQPGSLHYIPGYTAHRLANTGSTPLIVGACWPADAGHDYASIARDGFSVRLVQGEHGPVLVSAD